jgi:hypothetical protein
LKETTNVADKPTVAMKSLPAFLVVTVLRDVTSFVPLIIQKSTNWQRTGTATATTTTRLLDSSTPMDEVVQLDHEDISKAIDPLSAFIYNELDDDEEEATFDAANMRIAIQMAQSG